MPLFRKKPVAVEAVYYDPAYTSGPFAPEVFDAHPWLEEAYENDVLSNHAYLAGKSQPSGRHLRIKTLEGEMIANKGDWIIRGVKGELYPCKPDIFAETYDPA